MMDGFLQSLEGSPLAVRTTGLSKSFGAKKALRGLDLAVPEGSVYVLVGPNGAGKTTSLRILLDLVKADSGTSEVLGGATGSEGAWVRAQIGYVPDIHDFGYPELAVGSFLRHHRSYFPAWDETYALRLLSEFDISTEDTFGTLSKGQARRVQLVQAMAHRPPLLLLDEPTDGLDPLARDHLLGLLADHLAGTPTTVLLSTHLVHEVEGLGDHLGVLRGGRLVAQLPRTTLHLGLHHLRATIPEGWQSPPRLLEAAIVCQTQKRDISWTVWGDSEELQAQLSASGADLRHWEALNLEAATRAFLSMKER
ncbi:MAG: ABC transporter ATP-binding protein [Deltaproteobacteria bacterium]|nr:ABC transporter ATP-binding protein [Deltaproteobacteria bacterium]